ncbi:MAG TPA: FAD-dependent oxidoreductase, partial [Mycobacteriales bacterium]|nr:FAD-dependent oxidoreductase [Mycobacteriales bacterium]
MERLVVIGGDAGGMSAASQARRRRDPSELEIVVLERGRYTSYSACGIPYWVGTDIGSDTDLIVRTPEEFARSAIEVRIGLEATEIDPAGRQVRAGDQTLAFDQLLVATGATPVRPRIPGIDLPGVYGVQTLDDGRAVIEAMGSESRRAVVIGGGYIGLEMAEALIRRGLEVTLIEAGEQPMSTVDPDLGVHISEAMRGMGIEVLLQSRVDALNGSDRVRSAVAAGREIPADLVILGLGVRPNSALARDAGIACGASGGIAVDRRMRSTSHEFVWAAGDCVESFHRLTGRGVNIALGTHANKQGRVAGINIGGGYATFPGVIGT